MAVVQRDPGWYPDQTDPESLRYWNGRAWTARRKPVVPPAEAPTRPARAARRARPERQPAEERRKRVVWPWVVGAFLVARTVMMLIPALQPQDAPTTTDVHHATAPSSTSAPAVH